MPGGIWHERFTDMHEMGLTRKQAQWVFDLLNEKRAFGSEQGAQWAQRDLDAVYDEADDDA